MGNRLDGTIETPKYDNLFNGLYPPAEVFTVSIRKLAAPAVFKRGTALALSGGTAGDKKMVLLGTAAAQNEILTANCVLAEDIEVGTTADVDALAYRSGHFNANCLIVAEGHTISADDKEAFRTVGILLSDAIEI